MSYDPFPDSILIDEDPMVDEIATEVALVDAYWSGVEFCCTELKKLALVLRNGGELRHKELLDLIDFLRSEAP